MSYAALGRAVKMSDEQVARICRGQSRDLTIVRAAQVLSILGRRLSARSYLDGSAVRDAGHLALEARFERELSPILRTRREVPVVQKLMLGTPGEPDHRAWDIVVDGPGWTIGVEAETRLHDVQALLRRVNLKKRDGTLDHVVLLVSQTVHNRQVLRLAGDELRSTFPGRSRAALQRLRSGRAVLEDTVLCL